MLVLLPPSETKASGGDGPPLQLDTLSHPELTPTRRKLVDELVGLAEDVSTGRAALNLSERQVGELERNAALWNAPTLSALHRYTGVLYAALDAGSLPARAVARLAVASALFGLLAADDPIPAYRLSASSSLPGVGTVRSVWRPVLSPPLTRVAGCVVDLRSGAYAALAPLPDAVTIRVLCADSGGRRRPVSHHNKAQKGRLARLLASAPREASDADGVARIARRGGLRVERTGEHALDLIVGV
ncbi:MAG TPA: peroxide stress protein YaaA [Pseudonocardiaceae bacterium]|nr:peroxide stress protein YaaA [Pseudonocardiaceae bacterium]